MADGNNLSGSDIRRRFQQSDQPDGGGSQSVTTPPDSGSGADIRRQFREADAATPAAPTQQEQQLFTPEGMPMTTASDIQTALAPAPNTTYGDLPWTWVARDDKTGTIRFAMPNALRNPLLELFGGGAEGGPGVTTRVDPDTGKVSTSLSPSAAVLANAGANPLRFGASPGIGGALIDTTRAPDLPPNIVSPDLTTRIAERNAQAGAPATPAPSTPMPSRYTEAPSTSPPVPGPRVGAVPQTTPQPTASAEALPVATSLLEKAKNSGADLHPDYVNRFIDKVTADAEPAGPGTAAIAGPGDPVATMVQRLQALRDQPLNIKDVMGMDQELNARQRAAIKTDPDLARRLGNLQDSLRDQIDAATEADVGGGVEGWRAFKDGRAAYSQYKKMQAVEDMKERADGTQNPTTSYKTAVNNFINGPKSRGWTDEEKASLKDSADRGVIGGTLHMLGGRLVPYVAGAATFGTTGATEAIASMVAAHYAGEMVRNVGNALQTRRFNRTMGVLGSSIPNPLVPPAAP